MHDIPTVQQYVAHENQHEGRRWVLRMLAARAASLRELETEPETEDRDGRQTDIRSRRI
jgi:hypothetical protein